MRRILLFIIVCLILAAFVLIYGKQANRDASRSGQQRQNLPHLKKATRPDPIYEQKMLSFNKNCALPPIDKEERTVFLEPVVGGTLTSIRLGDSAQQVRVIDIEVDEGAQPLYIIASTPTSLIWRFSGAVERISHFIVIPTLTIDNKRGQTNVSHIGVVGLAKDAVSFPKKQHCLFEMNHKATKSFKSDWVKSIIGRVPDVIAGRPVLTLSDTLPPNLSTAVIKLPSGHRASQYDNPNDRAKQTKPTGGPSATLWKYGVGRGSYAGSSSPFIEISPEDVTSPFAPSHHTLLPGAAGIAQLIDDGVLEPIGWQTAVQSWTGKIALRPLRPNEVGGYGTFRIPLEFLVLKPMHFPTGNLNILSIADPTFVVPASVPVPRGDPHFACVISQDRKTVYHGRSYCLRKRWIYEK